MGAAVSDQAAGISPWSTQVIIDNDCTTPLRVYLARDPDDPTVENSIEHSVPPNSSYSIHSGWVKEPLATIMMRTGVNAAKVYRMPHMSRLKVQLSPTGLKVTVPEEVIEIDHPEPTLVPNNDTVPMVLREESFLDQGLSITSTGSNRSKVQIDGPRSPTKAKQMLDQVTGYSPWNTQVVIDNQIATPLLVYLARDPDEPAVKNSVEHSVPAQSLYTIHSGWLKEPLATLIMRVGIHEAKIFRMPHMAQLKVDLAPSGLKVTSHDPMIIEDHPDPGAVPNNDTVPMVLRKESFYDRRPGSREPRVTSSTQAVVVDWQRTPPPSNDMRIEVPPQFAFMGQEEAESSQEELDVNQQEADEAEFPYRGPAPTVHGRPAEERQGDLV